MCVFAPAEDMGKTAGPAGRESVPEKERINCLNPYQEAILKKMNIFCQEQLDNYVLGAIIIKSKWLFCAFLLNSVTKLLKKETT